jgi:hypothetical protein
MRCFGTYGPVYPDINYVVSRKRELADFVNRVKQGRYIVLFAPRQTGKTTFFRNALDALEAEEHTYLPIQLNFEGYVETDATRFYPHFCKTLCQQISTVWQRRGEEFPESLSHFLSNVEISDHISMGDFFEGLGKQLKNQKLIIIIDEFDGIPPDALRGFLHTLRQIYLSNVGLRCPYSLGIVGVKNITQLNYDRSISPFNIQDDFTLPNFTFAQVEELFSQYTAEVGQSFSPEVIKAIHKQIAGQPFLVNRCGQILTDELDIPKSETIQIHHFSEAYKQLLKERNTNISHLVTNIRRDPRFEKLLMRITFYGENRRFNLDDEIISELATYGIIGESEDGMCQIRNPIYFHRVLQAFQPFINGLEDQYFAEDGPMDFTEYVTPAGQLQMQTLIKNFNDFIARAGYRILQVPDTPQEFVGQYLLFAYLDEFVNIVRATMHLEVPTGRGRADLIIGYKGQKYIVETKVWRNEKAYQAGKDQLAAYLKLEGATEGYYIVFDYRENPNPQVETDTVDGFIIQSYVIPVLQRRPSQVE